MTNLDLYRRFRKWAYDNYMPTVEDDYNPHKAAMREVCLLMQDNCTESEAMRCLMNGTQIHDTQSLLAEIERELKVHSEPEYIESLVHMMREKQPAEDWGIVYDDSGNPLFISYVIV